MDERFIAALIVAGVAMAVVFQAGFAVSRRTAAGGVEGSEVCWRLVVNGSAASLYGYPVPGCFHDDVVRWVLGNYSVAVFTGVFRIRGHHELVLGNRVVIGRGGFNRVRGAGCNHRCRGLV